MAMVGAVLVGAVLVMMHWGMVMMDNCGRGQRCVRRAEAVSLLPAPSSPTAAVAKEALLDRCRVKR